MMRIKKRMSWFLDNNQNDIECQWNPISIQNSTFISNEQFTHILLKMFLFRITFDVVYNNSIIVLVII